MRDRERLICQYLLSATFLIKVLLPTCMSEVLLISEFVGKLLLSVTVFDCASSSTTLTDVVPRSMPRTKPAEQHRGQVSRHLWKRGQASRRQKFDARLFHELRYGYLERTKSIETPVFQRFSSNLPTNTSNLLKNYVYMRYFTKYSYFTFKDILQ